MFSCYLNFRIMSLHFCKNKTLSSEKTEEDIESFFQKIMSGILECLKRRKKTS